MTALPAVAADPLWVPEDIAWMRVEEPSAPGSVRRRAVELGHRIGLGETRIGELAIVATELATNLVKYAEGGEVLLRLLRRDGTGAVELVVMDRGPGMRDLGLHTLDGESTSGTLGIGLGAVARLASCHELHSVPGRGTVVTAVVAEDRATDPAPLAGLTRAVAGETECGDAWAARRTAAGFVFMVSDGLGHGPLAARASGEAVRLFRESTEESPSALLTRLHRGLVGTRGAATAIGNLDVGAGRLTYAGIGNIAGRIVGHDDAGGGRSSRSSRGLVSLPGIVGHNMRSVRDLVHEVSPQSRIVMHSDGLTEKWDVADHPGLVTRGPLVMAATLLRDAAVRRDDASVLVCRAGTR